MEYFDLVEQECPAPTGSAAFDFSASGALTGRFTFDSRLTTTGQTCTYTAKDASGNVETGLGTWNETAKTLARTTIYSSSNGDVAESFSGTVTVAMDWLADDAKNAYVAVQTVQPGGRLTLTSGVPVTSSDVTAATTIYYTPYLHSVIPLWNGASWEPVQFSETSLALGTITSGLPYDVFGYLSGGALALELLAWTDNANRATAITLQDGQYCKSGDHTRLYLGSFYTTSTTTTEDSEAKRFLWNMFNQVDKFMLFSDGSSNTYGHTYSSAGYRKYNNGDYIYLEVMAGQIGKLNNMLANCIMTQASSTTLSQIGMNWTDGSTMLTSAPAIGEYGQSLASNINIGTARGVAETPGAGKYTLHLVERNTSASGTITWGYASLRGYYKC